jgi:hypothetical protein
VLSNEAVLRRVLCCVGPLSHLQISTVCSAWKKEYHKTCSWFEDQCLTQPYDVLHTLSLIREPRSSYSLAFASPELLRMAVDSGAIDLSLSETQFNAGRHGSVTMLLLAHDDFAMPFSEAVVMGAVRSGCIEKFNWLREQYTGVLPNNTVELAARSGSLHILQQLQQEGLVVTEETAVQAVKVGHLNVVQFLHAEGCQLHSNRVGYTATSRRDASIFKWLHSVGCIRLTPCMARIAVRSGNIELIQYLQLHGIEPDHSAAAMRTAIRFSNLALCKHLHTTGFKWTPECTNYALESWASVGILDWALTLGVKLTAQQQREHSQHKLKHLSMAQYHI